MWDARGLTLEFGFFFLDAFDGTWEFDPFRRCLYLCVFDQLKLWGSRKQHMTNGKLTDRLPMDEEFEEDQGWPIIP